MNARRGSLAFVLLLLMMLSSAVGAGTPAPAAVQGRLDVGDTARAAFPLQGEWGFAWHRFVDPNWQQLPTAAFAPVPASWNDVPADGKPPGPSGWGSYVLLVNCPAGQSLAVEAAPERTAGRLFINGTEVAAFGEPGTSAATSFAAVYNRVPITREFACPLRLTLHVSNFDHRAGGFVRPMWAGPSDRLERQREARVVSDAALLTVYLLTGVVSLIFFALRRREHVPLLFGLFCLCMAVYTDLIGERLFLRPLAGQLPWFQYMRLEYLSWLAAEALFLLTLRSLFPAEIQKRAVQAVLALMGLATVAVLTLPPAIYSQLVLPGYAISVVVAGYVAIALLRAGPRSRGDARVLLAGLVAVLVTLAIDLWLVDVQGPDRKFSTLGFAIFLLSPAIVIGRRMSAALNAEERNRALEENARLREDVERISRHDLKTPLNSILGAARLLRDDPHTTADQRELVGVLQRASLRMLEMVNLSLGLFRMETGGYNLRPQPVDLVQVVTRVLVDLHSYAEANDVALHLRGSARAPLYVRGEELLCYSIVANLVKNAIEASGPGKRVSIQLQGGDPVVLAVHNPGVVPPDVAERFFQKYVSGGKSGGTGLGTYSARLMARAQQGDLQMHTAADTGTTLTLTLPPLQGDPPEALPVLPPPDLSGQWLKDMPPRQVLLVDDDEFTRLVTRRLLPSPPFRVETAANGQAAMEAMARRWPHFLLMDMEMPIVNGVDTVRWVRAQEAQEGRPRCGVIMLSGNDDEDSTARALAAGADRFLVKPASRELLLATLLELEIALPPRTADTRPPEFQLSDLAGPADEIVVVEPEWVEFFPDFVSYQRGTVEAMARALAAADREDLQFLAHRAKGGLATMGLAWAARQARFIEENAPHVALEALEQRVEALREHLGKVRVEPAAP